MGKARSNIVALRGRDNSTDSALGTGSLAEAIELLVQARAVLDCLESFSAINLRGIATGDHIHNMAMSAGAASRLVRLAQEYLCDAVVFPAGMGHPEHEEQ